MNGTRTYFFYSEEGLIAEYDSTGTEIRSYGYKPDSTWTTDPLWLKEGGAYYWYQNDHLGTPQKLVAQNGAVVWSAQYTAFGEAQLEVETVTNNLRFPGQYFDAETGLFYNWFRYYDPRIGRYLRVDPIGFDSGDMNLYGFVQNNPLTSIDPNGLSTREDIARGRLDYSCRCGWIDWGHATADAVAGLWDLAVGIPSNKGITASNTGKGFLVYYEQDMYPGSWEFLTIGHGRPYFVKYNLSPSEQESVALGIFREVSAGFETFQGLLFLSSSFSVEDLPSDLIAFYMAVRNYSPEYISEICGVVPTCVAEHVWDRAFGRDGKIGKQKNYSWTPRDYNLLTYDTCACPTPPEIPENALYDGCYCASRMHWPGELDTIQTVPKGSLWRDWTEDLWDLSRYLSQ